MAQVNVNETVAGRIDFGLPSEEKDRAWSWLEEHRDEVILEVNLLFFPVAKVTVGDLEDLFRRIF